MNHEGKIVVAFDAGISIRSVSDITDAIGACVGKAGLLLTDGIFFT